MLYGADADWWKHPDNRMARYFFGLKVCADDALLMPEVLSLKHTGKIGYDPDPTCIRSGGNSGYQALHIAIQAGAARVLLCGFDMRGGHWHGDHPEPLGKSKPENYSIWINRFEGLLPCARAVGVDVEILNCTPDSALTCFPMTTLDAALA